MSTAFEDEKARIAELAESIRQLKTDGKPCDVELKEMLDLKKKVGQSTGKKDSGKGKINLKTPKVRVVPNEKENASSTGAHIKRTTSHGRER